ncbi:hypothetical protein E3T55_10745 [Cryobacterium frigoriphilum]|uniref:Nucleotidyl transferase AbiEii/AbiGii toxin family protein n=1 Tax=Cryobacterium frigoriphilum TaxID=1259150 RepID=A0A4R9A0G0_9MICO|nr:nucleotidyl transferase AbiEii/AbiGii toxin family protein [Cryobacterium frigoriphilum]TFD49824.1 hypothetical protein E3T55_10745 [Cryobacterium frigoriphilum]
MTGNPLNDLPDKDRRPSSAAMLNRWVQDAQKLAGGTGARTGWILASTIVVAALQRTLGPDGDPLFLLKGGVYLEHKLGLASRATQDVDTLFRGELDQFLSALDTALAEPWGDITLTRSNVSVIAIISRRVKPRRFHIVLSLKGVTWRRIQVEVAFPEGAIADAAERFPAPRLGYFGVQTAAELAGITLAYQVAQKLHACSDPHQPPIFSNSRVRDIVDLLLIRETFYPQPTDLGPLRIAAEDVFAARAAEATDLGFPPRRWPPLIVSNPLWEDEYDRPAAEVKISYSLDDAIRQVNHWVEQISTS